MAMFVMLLVPFLVDGRLGAIAIVQVDQIRSDKACGPRCLSALMKITGGGRPGDGVVGIYKVMGRKPFEPTSLNDLKKAARKYGFSADGYRWAVEDLEKMRGYAILPVGKGPGTAAKPRHFILVKGVVGGYVTFINTRTLEAQALAITDLQKSWNGYVLVIDSGKGRPPLRKDSDGVPLPANNAALKKYDKVKDFGIIDSGSLLEHTFVIPNGATVGGQARIVKRSCSCLSATLGKDALGNSTVTMQVRVTKAGWQVVFVAIRSGASGKITRYAIRAYGRASFEITPSKGYIELPNGGIVEYPVRIEYFTTRNDTVKYDHLETGIPSLTGGPVAATRVFQGETCKYTFVIPLVYDGGIASARVRRVNGNVRFLFNTTKGTRVIPMDLSVSVGTPKNRCTPQKVFIVASKSHMVIRRRVKVEFLAESPPKSIAAKPDGIVPMDVQARQVSPGTYMIEICVSGQRLQAMSPGLHKGSIFVEAGGTGSECIIRVPVSVFVRE